jgi:hypothetical protein
MNNYYMNKVKKELNNIINNKYKTNNLSCGFISFILREEIFKGKEIEPNNSKLTYENVKNLLDNNYKVSILHDYKNHYKQFKSI